MCFIGIIVTTFLIRFYHSLTNLSFLSKKKKKKKRKNGKKKYNLKCTYDEWKFPFQNGHGQTNAEFGL